MITISEQSRLVHVSQEHCLGRPVSPLVLHALHAPSRSVPPPKEHRREASLLPIDARNFSGPKRNTTKKEAAILPSPKGLGFLAVAG
jgi:hypothetical protein